MAGLCATRVNAAEFAIARVGNAWALFLSGQDLNGNFDALSVTATPTASSTFLNLTSGNLSDVPRPPGDQFTYINRKLDQDILDGGLGWSIVGRTVTANEVSFAGGPLGRTIDTNGQPMGWLFLANLFLSHPEPDPVEGAVNLNINVKLVRAGTIVADIPTLLIGPKIIPLPVPEPATAVLCSASLIGVLALRWRAVSGHRN